MNIELTLDVALMKEIDRTARESGKSRDELLTAAMTEFLERSRNQQTAERSNDVYREPLGPVEEERE